jgi:hypothetical protein
LGQERTGIFLRKGLDFGKSAFELDLPDGQISGVCRLKKLRATCYIEADHHSRSPHERSEMRRIYNGSRYMPERTQLMQAWLNRSRERNPHEGRHERRFDCGVPHLNLCYALPKAKLGVATSLSRGFCNDTETSP